MTVVHSLIQLMKVVHADRHRVSTVTHMLAGTSSPCQSSKKQACAHKPRTLIYYDYLKI